MRVDSSSGAPPVASTVRPGGPDSRPDSANPPSPAAGDSLAAATSPADALREPTTAARLAGQPTTAERLAGEPAPSAGAATESPLTSETCKVDVRFTPVSVPLVNPNHGFVVTQDSNSTNYFRGGPSAGGPSGGSSGQSSSSPLGGSSQANSSGSGPSNSSNSSNSSSPGSGPGGPDANTGPWGSIRTDHGPYVPGTVDWTTSPSGQMTVATLPGNCDAIDAQLARHSDAIEDARIPYNPVGANSNSVARELLERSGIQPGNPPVWAPGWDTRLR